MSPLDSPCWYELVSEYISELDIEEFLPVLTFLDSYWHGFLDVAVKPVAHARNSFG